MEEVITRKATLAVFCAWYCSALAEHSSQHGLPSLASSELLLLTTALFLRDARKSWILTNFCFIRDIYSSFCMNYPSRPFFPTLIVITSFCSKQSMRLLLDDTPSFLRKILYLMHHTKMLFFFRSRPWVAQACRCISISKAPNLLISKTTGSWLLCTDAGTLIPRGFVI